MKRIVAYALLLALLGGISVWAYNSDKDHDEWIRSNNKFGHVTSEDSEGTLETLPKVTVDVDYPNEKWW